MREEIRQALERTAPPGMVCFVDDKIIRYMTPLAAACMRNNQKATYRKSYDLAGKRFGRLLVIRRSKFRRRKNWLWECICDCGNNHLVVGYNLLRGGTKSCGCLRDERSAKNGRLSVGRTRTSLKGRRFGRLEVLSFSHAVGKWICRCDCGATALIPAHNMTDGSTRSCGCLRRETSQKRGKANLGKARKAAA